MECLLILILLLYNDFFKLMDYFISVKKKISITFNNFILFFSFLEMSFNDPTMTRHVNKTVGREMSTCQHDG